MVHTITFSNRTHFTESTVNKSINRRVRTQYECEEETHTHRFICNRNLEHCMPYYFSTQFNFVISLNRIWLFEWVSCYLLPMKHCSMSAKRKQFDLTNDCFYHVNITCGEKVFHRLGMPAKTFERCVLFVCANWWMYEIQQPVLKLLRSSLGNTTAYPSRMMCVVWTMKLIY